MTTEAEPTGPKSAKGWLIVVAICAVAGAIIGCPGHGPVTDDDFEWTHWAGIVTQWIVTGAIIGVLTSRTKGHHGPVIRFVALYAIAMPVLMLTIEGIRVLAASYTGGWKAGITSVAIGAAMGAVLTFPLAGLMVGVGKLLTLVWPTPAPH